MASFVAPSWSMTSSVGESRGSMVQNLIDAIEEHIRSELPSLAAAMLALSQVLRTGARMVLCLIFSKCRLPFDSSSRHESLNFEEATSFNHALHAPWYVVEQSESE